MLYKIGMLCKHFKGVGLENKNIYRIIQLGVDGKDVNENIKYTGEAELSTATNLVVYENIFQDNKFFTREYEDLTSELSDENKLMYNQDIRVQPLTEEEIAIVNNPEFIKIKKEQIANKYNKLD